MVPLSLLATGVFTQSGATWASEKPHAIEKGPHLPFVTVIGNNGEAVNLDVLKGHVTLVSIVPQLNTPVCHEQTPRFSERNDGLDEVMTFVTLSTNTSHDQHTFATKADMHNMTFLSNAPDYHFGTRTGLFLDQLSILHRAVLVLDTNGIIRYVELVPLGQLPDFDQAFRVSRTLLPTIAKE
ncbi:MAG: redoxin family protein [Nitrospirales bacterium]